VVPTGAPLAWVGLLALGPVVGCGALGRVVAGGAAHLARCVARECPRQAAVAGLLTRVGHVGAVISPARRSAHTGGVGMIITIMMGVRVASESP
jgi:hypothetical protein